MDEKTPKFCVANSFQILSKNTLKIYDSREWDVIFFADSGVRIYEKNKWTHPEANFNKGDYIFRINLD